jgi:16S rRNA (cytosine967-C5)-methyltransferase
MALAAQQAALLDALWHTLAAGGKLLYATCSVFAAENGGQSTAFLDRHPDARGLPVEMPVSGDSGGAGSGATGRQWLPDAHHDGFFYALFQKR